MRILALPFLKSLSGLAPLLVRLGVGLIMALHGWQKWSGGPEGFLSGQMLAGLGIPAPGTMAYVVTLVELVGGIFLILGLLSRLSGLLIAIVLLVALFTVKLGGDNGAFYGLIGSGGAGGELDLALLVGALSVALGGPGGLSIDSMLGFDSD